MTDDSRFNYLRKHHRAVVPVF